MDILIMGLGYVGVTTALVFAELGWNVQGLDPDEARIKSLAAGALPFHEPGLSELLGKHVASGALSFSSDAESSIRDHSVIFLCVGTPSNVDGSASLTYVQNASE